MATVYLAHDLKHDRPVALKVLEPAIAQVLGAERFLREIQIAARLAHPHILPLYDSGQADGFLYYVMPYVEGESLRDRLNRERQLPVEDALRIAREVADALDTAHRHDVVHRDIKPENILLEEGHAVVADFGIARAVSAAGGDRLTATGLVVGTPQYMSPEQASGEGDVDGRSDVYAMGCVLYEMLAGEPPFTGPTTQAVLAKRFTGPAPSPRASRDTVPAGVDLAVTRALARIPADRPATAAEFAQALAAAETSLATGTAVPTGATRRRWGAFVGIAAVAVAVAGAWWLGGQRSGAAAVADRPMLAVLPFDNLGSARDEYFTDGVTEEITSRLAELEALGVISRTSAMNYKGSDKPLRQIGDELGVQYVLEGTVRWQHDTDGAVRVRVTPQLIRVSDDTHLWTDRYDAVLADIFAVQDEIAGKVATALGTALIERTGAAQPPTRSIEAYEAYLRGNDVLRRGWLDAAATARSVESYERAVSLDPDFAKAHAALAEAHLAMYWFNFDRTETRLALAKAAVDRALDLGPDLAEAHRALGNYHYNAERDYSRALAAFADALARKPNSADVLHAMGNVYRRQGRFEESIALDRRGMRIDPRSYREWMDISFTYLWLRRYREATEAMDQVLVIAPDWITARVARTLLVLLRDGGGAASDTLRAVHDQFGDAALRTVGTHILWTIITAEADERVMRAAARLPRDDLVNPGIHHLMLAVLRRAHGDARAALVHFDSARVLLEHRVQTLPDDVLGFNHVAVAYAGLGRHDDALRAANRAVELLPVSSDAFEGPTQTWTRAIVNAWAGRADAAIDDLEYLLSIPSYLSRVYVRTSRLFESLRGHPRFQQLVAEED